MVACGPFSANSNITYEGLVDLLEVAKNERPHMLILAGPFLDNANKDIFDGNLIYDDPKFGLKFLDYKTFFDNLLTQIRLELESVGTKVVIVPSLKDITHLYPFP